MKNNTIIFFILQLSAITADAQQFKWTKVLGSTVLNVRNITGGNEAEYTRSLCLDEQKNIYAVILVSDTALRADTLYRVHGNSGPVPSTPALLLSSYTCDGVMRWARVLEGQGDVKCCGQLYYAGSIYVAGRFGDTVGHANRYIAGVPPAGHDSQHYFLARFDTLGNMRWIRFIGSNDQRSAIFGGSLGFRDLGTEDHALGIDGQGNIHHIAYLTGGVVITPTLTAQTGTYNIRYDTAGTLLDAVRLGVDSSYYLYEHTNPFYSNRKNNISISKRSGKIFTVMYHAALDSANHSYWQPYLCAFASNGALIWKDSVSASATNTGQKIRDAVYDGANGIYLGGEGSFGQFSFNGTAPSYPGTPNGRLSTIIKTDTNGRLVWIYVNDHNGGANASLGNTIILPDGNILAAGISSSGVVRHGRDSITKSVLSTGPFYTIVTPQGDLVRMDQVVPNRSVLGFSSGIAAVAADKVGNIYFGGCQGNDTMRYPGGLVTTKFPNQCNSYDAFIAKLGYDCRCTAVAHAGYKDSIAQGEGRIFFTYTGTTEVIDSLVWSFGDGQTLKVTTAPANPVTHSFAAGHPYSRDTVCVTVYSGCGTDKYCRYPQLLSVAGIKGLEEVRVYPNPASAGRFRIELEAGHAIGGAVVTLSSITGQELCRRAYRPAGSRLSEEIDVRGAAPGVYFLSLVADGDRVVRRIVLE